MITKFRHVVILCVCVCIQEKYLYKVKIMYLYAPCANKEIFSCHFVGSFVKL